MKQYSLLDLTTYKAVIEAGSFHLAAERLNTSPATVSRRINSLELALRTRLINRTTRNLSMTEAGEQYLNDVENILTNIECSEERLRDGASEIKGELRISAPLSFGIKCLSPVLPDFLNKYPKININLNLDDGQTDLQAEGIDIGIRISKNIKDSSIVATPIGSIELGFYASPQYIKDNGKPNNIKELEAHNFLGYTLVPNNQQIPLSLNTHPKIRFKANNGEALRDAAVNGIGIVVLPLFIINDEIKEGRLVKILENHNIESETLYVIRLSRRFTPAKVRAMIDYLKTKITDLNKLN